MHFASLLCFSLVTRGKHPGNKDSRTNTWLIIPDFLLTSAGGCCAFHEHITKLGDVHPKTSVHIICRWTERSKAEVTSRREACALSAAVAASVSHVTSSLQCDVNITSSADEFWRIPFVPCISPLFSAARPSLTGQF